VNYCQKYNPGARQNCSRIAAQIRLVATLPVHLCEETARASCKSWLKSVWPLSSSDDQDPAYQLTRTVTPWGEEVNLLIGLPCAGSVIRLPISPGVYALVDDPEQWPIPLSDNGGMIRVVIRQWGEEEPKPSLTKTLEGSSTWQNALRVFARVGAKSENPNAQILRVLASCGFPTTPGTIDYFKHRAAGGSTGTAPRYPTRGALVTSICISPYQWPSFHVKKPTAYRTSGDVVSHTVHSGRWTSAELQTTVARMCAEHEEWWRTTPERECDPGDLRRANRSRRQPDSVDHLIAEWRAGSIPSRKELADRALEQHSDKIGRELGTDERRSLLNMIRKRIERLRD